MGSLNLKLSKVINKLRMSIRNRVLFVEYKEEEIIPGLFECLQRERAIFGFICNGGKVKVFLRYDEDGVSPIKSLQVEYKRPFVKSLKSKYIKSKNFYKKSLLKNGVKTSSFILTTSKGILTHEEALFKNVGGTVLLFIKYS